MKNIRIAQGIIVGIVVILAIFFIFFASGNAPSPEEPQHPLFVLINQDDTLSRSVDISVSDPAGSIISERNYMLGPKEKRDSEIVTGNSPEEYTFVIRSGDRDVSNATLILGPTNVAVIEIISGDQSEWISYSIADLTSKSANEKGDPYDITP